MALHRRIAYVNLTTGDVSSSPVPVSLRRLYLGGRGLGAYLLFNHARPGTDPLTTDNVLAVCAGLLCGAPAPAASFTAVTTKSPLTGLAVTSLHGGFFGPELRWAGFDGIVIKGQAKSPVVLFVEDGEIRILPAESSWGLGTAETREKLREELGDPDVQVLSIGPAGENRVRFACPHSEAGHGWHRGGTGAVMGSKNLKALAVRGTRDIELKKPREAHAKFREAADAAVSSAFGRRICRGGIFRPFAALESMGLLRSPNPTKGAPNDDPFSFERIRSFALGSSGCLGCPLSCRMTYRVPAGDRAGQLSEGPDFLTLAAFGPLLGCRDLSAVLVAQDLCVHYGLDPIETAGLVAWAMELAEAGLLPGRGKAGANLAFGNAGAIPDLLGAVAVRSDLGALLAEGAARACAEVGKKAEAHLRFVKGMCTPPIEERVAPSFALAAAVGSFGADHRTAPWIDLLGLGADDLAAFYGQPVPCETAFSPSLGETAGKAQMVRWHENCAMAADSLGVCTYAAPMHGPGLPGFTEWSRMVSQSLGLLLSSRDLWEAAERSVVLERMFNLREGMTAKADEPPPVLFRKPARGKKKPGEPPPLDRDTFGGLLAEYYRLRDWDARGKPESSCLASLGLEKEPTYML
jgi:aldehyde:ferredoxin oxidoreductase